ncbi:hypothetical protein [Bergeyella sp. RCAD1439]|uniref:hypothetical protein n=1 Tax=Bergeyella anatis TaxID=3113737 RepID=UPI002E16CB41
MSIKRAFGLFFRELSFGGWCGGSGGRKEITQVFFRFIFIKFVSVQNFNVMIRQRILERIMEEQGKIIDNLKESVERYRVASDIDEDSTLDPEDYSRQAEAKEMQLRFEKLLSEAQNVQRQLALEPEQAHEEVAHGALVQTDKHWLFVGVSLPVFEFEGRSVLAVSDDAPIYAKWRGCKVGDQVEVGSSTVEITAIF